MFFQTVVEALPGHRERRPPLTFADWNRRSGGSPATLGAADLPMLSDCGGYFARKFDASVDAEILDLIDDELLARPDRRQQSART
jgi:hypothetical protein